jgi:hypothetical protein
MATHALRRTTMRHTRAGAVLSTATRTDDALLKRRSQSINVVSVACTTRRGLAARHRGSAHGGCFGNQELNVLRRPTTRSTANVAVGRATAGSLEQRHAEFFALVGKHTGVGVGGGGGEVSLTFLPGGVAEIVVSNPSTRGSLTGSMMLQLARAVDTLCPPPTASNNHRSAQTLLQTPLQVVNTPHGALVNKDAATGVLSLVSENSIEVSNDHISHEGNPPPCEWNSPPRGLLLRGTDGMFSSGANFDLCTTLLRTPEKGLMMVGFMTDALTALRTAPFVSVSVVVCGIWQHVCVCVCVCPH